MNKRDDPELKALLELTGGDRESLRQMLEALIRKCEEVNGDGKGSRKRARKGRSFRQRT